MAAADNLKCFAIAGRTNSSGTAIADCDQEELRLPLAALLTPGYLPNLLTQAANPNSFRIRRNPGSDMNLLVGSGTSKVDGYVLLGTVAGQGAYIIRLDATTKTIAVPAADATNPARYGVYAYTDDAAYSGTGSRAYANVSCIRGTPAGSPTTPGPLAVWSAYALLHEFQLPANATAITDTILDAGTDRRTASYSPMGSVPRGSIQMYAGATVPSGWLACDGSTVSRSTYASLFAAIGTTWGVGDGSTTFDVPTSAAVHRSVPGPVAGSRLARWRNGRRGDAPVDDGRDALASARSARGRPEHLRLGRRRRHRGQPDRCRPEDQATGDGGAHNNMQPSAVVTYIIRY